MAFSHDRDSHREIRAQWVALADEADYGPSWYQHALTDWAF